MQERADLEAIFDQYESILLEPKTVSGWLGLPGSQLPRETAKIIGQPAQPAKQKGSSARYSFEDAILMKLGRTLMNLGITPHRVRACVDGVRRDFHTVLTGRSYPPKEHLYVEVVLYLVGREALGGFQVVLVPEEDLSGVITESGLAQMEWQGALVSALKKRMADYMKEPISPELNNSRSHPRQPNVYRPKVRELLLKARDIGMEESEMEEFKDIADLALEGYELIEWTDPGTPAIVQNVTRFVQDQSRQLYRHIEKTKPQASV